MTVIRPNSVSGITSITAQANEINVFRSNGTLAGLNLNGVNFNTTAGISTLAALDVGNNIKFGNAGVVTATSYRGDGSQLTGISAGVSLANGVDNRVVTATGAAALNGEANLTFDGSTLGIVGAATLGNGSGLNWGNTSARIRGESGASGLLRFDTNGGEKVRITSSGYIHAGNIGHGNNKVGGQEITGQNYDPYFKLYASTANHWLMQLRSDSTSGNGIFLRSGNSSSTYTLYATGYDESNPHLVVRGDGHVGIGTAIPSDAAHANNTSVVNVGIVTCNELYVSGIKVTGGGHYADLTAAAADGMSHYLPGNSTSSLISNLSATSTGSPVANQTSESYFNNYPYYDFYTGNANENGYIYTQTTAKWGGGPFSIAFWVKPMASTLESESTFVQLGDHFGLRSMYTVSTDASRQIKTITIGDDSSPNNQAVLSTDWNHWVTTYESGVTKYYLNGSLARSHTHSGSLDVGTNNKYIYVGYGYWNSTASNKASMSHMSDIGIWNAKALSASTISSIYNAKRTVVGY